MITHTVRLAIRRSLPDVFAMVTELDTHLSHWARGVVAVDRVSAGPTATGTEFMVVARVGPFRMRSGYRVLAYEKESIFAGRGVAGPFRFTEHYSFAPGEGGVTVVEYATEMRSRGGFRILERILSGPVHRLLDADFRRLRQALEVEEHTVPTRDAPTP